MRHLKWALACAAALSLASSALAQELAPPPLPSAPLDYVLPASGDYIERSAEWVEDDFPPTEVILASQNTLEDPVFWPAAVDSTPQAAPLPPGMDPTPLPGEYVQPMSFQGPPPDDGVVRIDRNCAAYGGPYFEAVVEPILWRLEHTNGQPVAINPVLGETTNTDDLDLGMRVGVRTDVSYLSDESENVSGFQLVYFGVYDWDGSETLVAPAGTYLRLPDTLGDPGVTADFSAADAMRLHYESRLNSLELNLLFGDPLASFHVIFGPRFVQLDERFNIDSFTGPRVSFYEVVTRDELLGLQLGGRWRVVRNCWEFGSYLKVGAYNNKTRQTTLMTDDDRTEVLRDFSTRDTVASFVLDGGISATRQIGRIWLLRIGYSVFLMDHIARAADQLDFSDNAVSGSRVFYRQDAVAHGLDIGLEARW